MHFFTFLLKNLLRRPARTLLTIVGLAVAVGAVVSLVGVASGFKDSFMKIYESRDVDLVVTRAGGTEAINNGLPEQLQGPLTKLKGVKQVVGGLVDTIQFRDQGLLGVLLNGWPPDSPLFSEIKMISGQKLTAADTDKIILGRVFAANMNKKVGDTIELYNTKKFEVVGIYESPIVYENGGAVILLKELQSLINKPNETSGFTISAEKPIDEKGLDDLAERIKALQPGLQVKKSAEFVNNVQQIKMINAVAWITSAIALVIGAIGMLNTMIMSVFERTKEIGTLRAIGWRRTRIIQMVIGESLLLSLGGAIVGSVAGLVMVKLLTELPNTSGLVSGNISLPVILWGFFFAILVGVFGAIYPALWSANLLPTEALRRK
ncbi:MAG TPA: ABC transporter permease [Pirellulales bacterium]|jgi:putative ABC transport system permease protein|nr:ABC transporter permease [Pirellulales bacterium]